MGVASVALQDSNGCVVVDLRPEHAPVARHIQACAERRPFPWHIARLEVDANRRASLRGVETRPGYDRDECPPAMADEGGEGASVRYVKSSVNRSAGSLMGRVLRPYPNGTCFEVVP